MKRSVLLAVAWIAAALGLYIALVVLELYWNLYDWQPVMDLKALGLVCGAGSVLVAMAFLARTRCHAPVRWFSFVICLALLALGLYVLPREPTTQGLFAREHPSPAWYREARLILLVAPSLLWGAGFLRRRKRIVGAVD